MRSALSAWFAPTPPSGTLIPIASESWASLPELILPPLSARTSIKDFTIPFDAADKLSCRPDFAVIVYPGYLALEDQNFAPNADIHPTGQTPPTFIVQAEDDPVHVENAVVYFLALKNAKVPAELHIYAQGGHGYGLRRTELPVTTWPQSVEIWLHTIHVLPDAR